MTTREMFRALSEQNQRRVVAVLRSELARGWIPKESDLRSLIEAIRLHPSLRGRGA